jgi:hypothetical protein
MSETLYPHEVMERCWNKNCFRIISTTFFIFCGIFLALSIRIPEQFNFVTTILFLSLGILYSKLDYESRSLN